MFDVMINVQREPNTVHSETSGELGGRQLHEKLLQVCSSETNPNQIKSNQLQIMVVTITMLIIVTRHLRQIPK